MALALSQINSSAPDNRIIYFHASYCHYCPSQTKIIKDIEKSGVVVRYIDVQKESNVARMYKVNGVPTTIIVNVVDNQAREMHRFSGQTGKDRIVTALRTTTYTKIP